MDAFKRNQAQFRSAMEGAFAGGPFAEIAKRNMEMFEAASAAFKPKPGSGAAAVPKQPAEPAKPASSEDELLQLKNQLAGLQDKIDKLTR